MDKAGNPQLKAQSNFNNELSFGGKIGNVNCNVSLKYAYINKPLMNDVVRTEKGYSTIVFNGKYSNMFTTNVSLSYPIVKDLIFFNARGGINNSGFYSNRYSSKINTFNVVSGIVLAKKNFNIGLNYYKDADKLNRGIEKQFGNQMFLVDVKYIYRDFSFSFTSLISLKKDTGKSMILAKDYWSEKTYKWYGNRPLLKIGIVYSFECNRKFRSIQQLLYNGDNDKGRF